MLFNQTKRGKMCEFLRNSSFSKLCTTEKQTISSLSLCQFGAGMLAEGKWHKQTEILSCLQTLLTWDCRFKSSSNVTARTLCSRTCSTIFVQRVSLSIKGLIWCFCLNAVTILFVFPGELRCGFGGAILIDI